MVPSGARPWYGQQPDPGTFRSRAAGKDIVSHRGLPVVKACIQAKQRLLTELQLLDT